MSHEARALVPVNSVLPEEGLDLVLEVQRYQVFLIDQAIVRANGNKTHAAELLGLNRTTLVEMMKRLSLAEPKPASAEHVDVVPLREQIRDTILETYSQCDGNMARTAEALGIGRTTVHRYLRRMRAVASPEVVELPEREPDTLPGAPLVPPPSEPAPSSEPPPELPDEEPIGAPPAPQAAEAQPMKSEPPTGVHCIRIRRSDVAALRAQGLEPREIAGKLGCSRFLVEKVLRSPAPLAKCGG